MGAGDARENMDTSRIMVPMQYLGPKGGESNPNNWGMAVPLCHHCETGILIWDEAKGCHICESCQRTAPPESVPRGSWLRKTR